MFKTRLEFSKTGRAAYISHLDLLNVMRRSLARAGADVWRTEGFNPHIYVSSLLPLPVGHESLCEILEFILLSPAPEGLARELRSVLSEGLRPIRVYPAADKPALIRYASYEIRFFSDTALDEQAADELRGLLGSGNIVVTRKGKKGDYQAEISGMIAVPRVDAEGGALTLRATLSANSQSFLNPDYLVGAARALPRLGRACAAVTRTAILKEDMSRFE